MFSILGYNQNQPERILRHLSSMMPDTNGNLQALMLNLILHPMTIMNVAALQIKASTARAHFFLMR